MCWFNAESSEGIHEEIGIQIIFTGDNDITGIDLINYNAITQEYSVILLFGHHGSKLHCHYFVF